MKILRKIIALAVVVSISVSNVFANYPVIDISNLMNAVTQLYAIYDEVNATIEQVQNTYNQLNKQIESMKNMNWDDLQSSFDSDTWSESGGVQGAWENIGNFRTNLTNATNAINENLNIFQGVKNTLENKSVTCMGKQYSVAGLFGIGKYGQNNLMNMPAAAIDYVKNAGEEIAKGYAGKLTYKEKQDIMQKWGLSPENYAYVKLVEEQVSDITSTLITKGSDEWYTAQMTKAAENNDALLKLSNNAGESMVSQMQATGGMILAVKEQILNLTQGVRETGAMFAKESVRKQVQEQAEKEDEFNRRERERLEWQKQTGKVPKWL